MKPKDVGCLLLPLCALSFWPWWMVHSPQLFLEIAKEPGSCSYPGTPGLPFQGMLGTYRALSASIDLGCPSGGYNSRVKNKGRESQPAGTLVLVTQWGHGNIHKWKKVLLCRLCNCMPGKQMILQNKNKFKILFLFKTQWPPWMVWLSGSGDIPQSERLPVWFPVRAHAWVVRQVHGWGPARDKRLMFLSHIYVSLPLFLPPFPSL